jgi:tetratricopeptide (TPR) repeat protein
MDEDAKGEIENAMARVAGIDAERTLEDEARAEAHGEMGILFHAKGLLEASLPCYHNARLLAAGEPRWSYYLARAYLELGQGEAARDELRATLALAPDYVPAWIALAESELEAGDVSAASDSLERALAVDPRCGRAMVGQGRIAMVERRYQDAVERFEQALALAPNSNALHYLLARAYHSIGDEQRAQEHMDQRGIIQVGLSDPWLNRVRSSAIGRRQHLERGISLARSGQRDEAVVEFRKAVQVSPEDPQVWFYLGHSLIRAGKAEEAAEVLEAALEIDADHPQINLWLATLLAARGLDTESIAHYRVSIRTNPNVARAHLGLGQALQRIGKDEAALESYRETLAIDPGNAQARLGRAFARIRLGRWAEARVGLEDDLLVYEEQPIFAHVLTRLLAAAPDDSVRDGVRAARMAEGLAPRLQVTGMGETLAMAYAEVGRFDLASRVQQGVLDAVKQMGSRRDVERVERNLALYRGKQPCRTPWAADDPAFRPARPQLD